MARKPGKNGKSSTPMATTLMLPDDNVLVGGRDGKGGLEETQRVQIARARSATGVYRSKVKDAVEKSNLDAAAWADAIKYKNLDDETLHVRYFHFMHYLEVLGVTKRATAQEEMFAAGETGASPKTGADTDDAETTTSKRIGAAARKVAEEAGATMRQD